MSDDDVQSSALRRDFDDFDTRPPSFLRTPQKPTRNKDSTTTTTNTSRLFEQSRRSVTAFDKSVSKVLKCFEGKMMVQFPLEKKKDDSDTKIVRERYSG